MLIDPGIWLIDQVLYILGFPEVNTWEQRYFNHWLYRLLQFAIIIMVTYIKYTTINKMLKIC